MIYPFSVQQHHLSHHRSDFTDDEISRIRDIGDELQTTNVKLYGEFDDTKVKASGSHFGLTDETRWMYDRMAKMVSDINRDHYQYDLTGFHENFYYLTYREGDHFNWHLDAGEETPAPRKLSLVLHLSDPSEYEGGEFDVMVATNFVTAGKRKGIITAFPSFKIHRVRPVTSGIRRVLTAFAAGPNFR